MDTVYGTSGISAEIGSAVAPMRKALRAKTIMAPAFKLIPYSDHRFVWRLPINEINNNPTLKN